MKDKIHDVACRHCGTILAVGVPWADAWRIARAHAIDTHGLWWRTRYPSQDPKLPDQTA